MANTFLKAGASITAIGEVCDVPLTDFFGSLAALHRKLDHDEFWSKSTTSCAVEGGLAMVMLLQPAGIDINEPAHYHGGCTALQQASQNGDLDVVEHPIQEGADTDAPPAPWRGVTTLQAAASCMRFDVVCRLLQ